MLFFQQTGNHLFLFLFVGKHTPPDRSIHVRQSGTRHLLDRAPCLTPLAENLDIFIMIDVPPPKFVLENTFLPDGQRLLSITQLISKLPERINNQGLVVSLLHVCSMVNVCSHKNILGVIIERSPAQCNIHRILDLPPMLVIPLECN